MARDGVIEKEFLAADDAIQGLWGLHRLADAAFHVADLQRLVSSLPDGRFKLTHEWERYFGRDELVTVMRNIAQPVQCRASLVLLYRRA
jgi:hypothetical protein